MASMRIALNGAAFAALLVSATAVRADNAATGMWIDHTGRGGVEITDCGGKLCGHVAWLKDAKNNDQCGKQIIGNVKSVGTNKWDNGWIFDPDRGSKYDVAIATIGADKLKVTGYAGTKWLSETYTWKRAPADLQKCSSSSAAATPATESAKVDAKTEAATTDTAKTEPETKPEAKPADAAKVDDKADAPKSDTAKSETTNPDATKSDSAKVDDAKPDAKEEEDTAENNDNGKDASKMVSRIIESLDDGGDEGDGTPKKKGRCKFNVPYVDMTVDIPCDK